MVHQLADCFYSQQIYRSRYIDISIVAPVPATVVLLLILKTFQQLNTQRIAGQHMTTEQ